MANILWFKDIRRKNIPECGGKGANLGEMMAAGFPVPPGFAVTSEAYFKFVKDNGIDRRIEELTEGLDVQDTDKLHEVSRKIKEAIMQGKIGDELESDIVKAYNELCGATIPTEQQEKYVAVRSSATAEDLPEASFAGQQATFLNVKGAKETVKAVQKCWASLFESRAIYYRQEKGFDHMKVGLSAIVQEMVQSERAGVMFTVEPMSNDENLIAIEAAYGLGEVVVAGSVSPDRYIVNKKTLDIVEKNIAQQEWMITKVKGKNEKVTVKSEFQEKQKLSDDEIMQLAKYGRDIEKHYKFPQDIEWAAAKGELYIVQSRPITTLKKKGEGKSREEVGNMSDAKVLTKGLAASPGVASGPVKIIESSKEIGKMEKGAILVTDMTTPDFVPAMKKAVGIITNSGGMTAHAAIVSREMGIPCIVGTKDATEVLKDGMMVTMDAHLGRVYEGEISIGGKEESGAGPVAGGPSAITTGTKVYVNLAEKDLAGKVAKYDVDGVGLLRAEFMIADIGEHPRKFIEEEREEEFVDRLADGMRTFASAFYPRPVVYRTTDFKTNEYRNLKGGEKYEDEEANPMMGYRGCARYISEPEVFKMELKAIKKVRDEFGLKNLWMMLPFVRRIGELRAIKEMLHEVGIYRTRDFQLWIMVEVPSTVIQIDQFCKEGIDGVSIGSNDLTQLTLGIDRDNESLAQDFDERNEAVLRSIRHVITVGKRHGVTVSICGQAPSVYPDFTRRLVEYGITSVSVNPDAVDRTRKLISSAEKKVMLNRLERLVEKLGGQNEDELEGIEE
ncbi:phosphoenolpyruvate synthase [Candidatus Micrarchaeota archaeon]|nr:MAG: phosphoenolpyruvate synthase [Candidatus Micrarchaeota archaeon]